VAELIQTIELTDPTQSGWAVDHRMRRDDGEEVHVEVRCWDEARRSAERSGNEVALLAIADRGVSVARELAERVDSPAERGAVLISIWFDLSDGGRLRSRVGYEIPRP
jgi:hypothetical protein